VRVVVHRLHIASPVVTPDPDTTPTPVRVGPGVAGSRRAGRYVVGELLGRGGMAEVFAGRAIGSHGFRKPVAIKRLLPELASDDVFVARLIAEAKLLVGMQHGNLVSVIDLAREGDDVFLVMEYVDGPSLRELLKSRTRALGVGVATYIVQAAAAGIELAHSRGVIHADISPTNILLTTSGEVRVADFGIARKVGGGHGMVEGKWAYMSPEQARGAALTPASDVFSLGIVLYELLAGQHPFGSKTNIERRVVPLRELRPDAPVELEAICARALASDPRARFPRMQDVIDALVEVRFAYGLRDGASELAAALRGAGEVRALGTADDSPRKLVTSSLLAQLAIGTPAQGVTTPSPELVTPLRVRVIATPPPNTPNPMLSPFAAVATPRTAPMAVPAPPTRPSLVEFAAVVAGEPVRPPSLAAQARTLRYALIILAIAALIGAIAAVASQSGPGAAPPAAPTAPAR
jgi:serine/threonine-protein kinase